MIAPDAQAVDLDQRNVKEVLAPAHGARGRQQDGEGRGRRADGDHSKDGSMSEERAHDYKRELVAAKRYVRDVY